MKKKLLSALLAVSIIASLFTFYSFMASADTSGYYTYTVSNGEAEITGCNTSISGDIEIPSTLGGYPVTSIGYEAFYYCTGLTSITIPDSVTSIGDSAFSNCTGLTSVTIGNGVTSIGGGAFFNCTGLTSITIPDSVTYIGGYAFEDCTGLTSVTIGNGVTSIGDFAFYGCTGLTSITIPDSVTSIGDTAFSGCTGLTSITIPDSVTSIGDFAFYGCTGLTSVTIGNSVTGISGYAFSGCTGLENITVASGNLTYYSEGNSLIEKDTKTLVLGCKNSIIPSNVRSIGGYAFSGYTGLTSITIPDSVTSIGDSAFSNCTGLTSITIPDSVTYIGYHAFEDCTGLTSVTIGNSVKSIGWYAFSGCTGLISITIPDSVTSIGYLAFSGCTELESIIVSSENEKYYSEGNSLIEKDTKTLVLGCKNSIIPSNVRSIGGHAFSGCTGLTSITIPDSVTSIGDSAFSDCAGLTSIIIPDSVTNIGQEAFCGCSGLTSITIPDSVTNIGSWAFQCCNKLSYNLYNNVYYLGNNDNPYFALVEAKNKDITDCTINNNTKVICDYAFYYCTGLTSVTIGNSVTSIGDAAFFGRTGLTSITIPDGVTSIGDEAFYGCTGLTSVTIGNSVTNIESGTFSNCTGLTSITIPDSVTNIESGTFSGCTGLTSITIPDSVTSIGNSAFEYCTGLTSVTIGNGVTSIGGYAFSDCTGLTSITIPDSVTSIGYRAFYGCTRLTSITIPDGVTSIGDSAFYRCSGLKQVIYIGTNAQYSSISIGSGNNDFTNIAPIYHIVHTFDDDLDTTCDICGYVRIVETSGDGWDYDDGKMTFDGEITAGKWEEFAGKVTEITMGKSVKEIGDDFFSHFDKLEKFIIMGNPTVDANALPDDPDIEICGWSNTNIQSACETKGLKFKSLEEFTIAGYQNGYKEENSFRAAAQMRYAEYYTAAGYDITAVGSDGYGHKFNRQISHEITTVYKSLTGRLENGSVGTVKTADEGCYLSAIGFTELPEMTGDGAIIFTITPYVYNPYSGEKISLEPVEFKYTADGVKPFTSLKLNNGSSDGKEIAWSDFED